MPPVGEGEATKPCSLRRKELVMWKERILLLAICVFSFVAMSCVLSLVPRALEALFGWPTWKVFIGSSLGVIGTFCLGVWHEM